MKRINTRKGEPATGATANDAIYNAQLLQSARALAVNAPPGPISANLTSGVAASAPIYQNTTTLTLAVYIRADSSTPNTVTALYLASAAQICNANQAPVASYSAPYDAVVVLPPNKSVYGMVTLSGVNTGVIIATGIQLTGETAVFGAT